MHTRAKQEKLHKRIKYINLPFSLATATRSLLSLSFPNSSFFSSLECCSFYRICHKVLDGERREKYKRTHTIRQMAIVMLSFLCHCRLSCRLGILCFFFVKNLTEWPSIFIWSVLITKKRQQKFFVNFCSSFILLLSCCFFVLFVLFGWIWIGRTT